MSRPNPPDRAGEPRLARFLRVLGARTRSFLRAQRGSLVRVRERAEPENVYHCCVHKTASQWLRGILGDPTTYRYSGLRPHHYQSRLRGAADTRPITRRRFEEPFPRRTIVTPLYVDLPGFRSIPKPPRYRAFFVSRDPRDVVVSSYFSIRYSHRPMGALAAAREVLETESEEDGLLFVIDHLEAFGLFGALRSWAEAPPHPAIRRFKFEELVGGPSHATFLRLLEHLDIRMPGETLSRLLDKHSFERLSGRPRGVEDARSHYRRGVAGDWRNHFTPRTSRHFREVTGDLVARLGYEAPGVPTEAPGVPTGAPGGVSTEAPGGVSTEAPDGVSTGVPKRPPDEAGATDRARSRSGSPGVAAEAEGIPAPVVGEGRLS